MASRIHGGPEKYYVWLDVEDKPLSKAWPYEDETERMTEEHHPPAGAALLRTGTREQLMEQYALHKEDFADYRFSLID